MQRALNFAIVDEVDSILIDEARTPLIISGQADDNTSLYLAINQIAPQLTRQEGEADPRTGEGVTKPGDFTVDEKSHQVFLTEQGHENAEAILTKAGLLPKGPHSTTPRTSCWCTTCTLRCGPTTFTTATSITWCKTAKW